MPRVRFDALAKALDDVPRATRAASNATFPGALCCSRARADTKSRPIWQGQARPCACASVRTVRAECLDWLLIVGRRHLETALSIYAAHYNRERPHRGLALLSPDSTDADPPAGHGEIKRRDRLGGLIHEYHRSAA